MKRQACRSDFISDGSSSEDDNLPELGSLRDRLAKKRNISVLSALSSSVGNSDRDAEVTETNGRSNESQIADLHDIKLKNDDQCINSSKDTLTNTLSDSSGDEVERSSLSQVISSAEDGGRFHDGRNFEDEIMEKEPLSEQGLVEEQSKSKVGRASESKAKKKRTAEEIVENKRLAQEKKEQREKQKMAKEAEKQMRKAERESKKQFSLGSCLKFIKVFIDTHVVNTCGMGVALLKACEELGVASETKELPLPFTIMWRRQVTECNMAANMKVETTHNEVEEQELLAIIPVADFVHMVNTFKMKQRGQIDDGIGLRDYVNQMKACLPDRSFTLIVPGLEQYFRDLKSRTQRQYRDAVQSNSGRSNKPSKSKSGLVTVSRVDVEEAVTDTLLQTDTSTFMLETTEEVADMVRRFTKAVAERPAKKDRFDPVFSFHEEGVGGVKVDKNGVGLLKVWKQQLLQFKNISPDVSQAIIAEYPSPLLLRQAYQKCSCEKEAIKLLENIVVRRGAGVLETTRRVGKELSRRIFLFFTSEDHGLVIK